MLAWPRHPNMKRLIILFGLLFHMAFASLRSIAWTHEHVIPSALMPASRIPQFIRDTQHPWLEQHRIYLELLDDPKRALCDLKSDLRPAKKANSLQYPVDFFRNLEIDNNRAGVDRPGWKNAASRLQEILACPAALNDIEDLNVQIWVDPGQYAITRRSAPPKTLPPLFVEALSSMPHLRKLEWNTFGNSDEVFQKAFTSAGLTLPSVRHLVPAMYTDYLVPMCPGVVHIESGHCPSTSTYWRYQHDRDGRSSLINSTRTASNLTTFHMRGEWEFRHLEELLDASPNITSLSMTGELASMWTIYQYKMAHGPGGQILKEYTNILSKFPHLQDLRLPHSSGLGFDFDGGAWCGNAYFGPEGRQYGRLVSQEDAETTEVAGQIVLLELPDLESLRIGSYCANLTKDDDDKIINTTWPWTGRMKEWTYEIWPDREDSTDGWY